MFYGLMITCWQKLCFLTIHRAQAKSRTSSNGARGDQVKGFVANQIFVGRCEAINRLRGGEGKELARLC